MQISSIFWEISYFHREMMGGGVYYPEWAGNFPKVTQPILAKLGREPGSPVATARRCCI